RGQRTALHGGERGAAAIGFDLEGERGGIDVARDHVIGQQAGQVFLRRRLEQPFDGAGRQLPERGVGGCEHGERAGALQRVDQPRGLHGGDQGGVVGRGDGGIDDVAGRRRAGRGVHRGGGI